MATKTTNYNLIKPALEDDADIRVINGNMDVLDTNLKQVADSTTKVTNNAYSDVTVSDDYTWKFTKGSGANVSYDTIKTATSVKNTTVQITADNGTHTNIFEVSADGDGSQYNFNGLTTYMNSNDDYFRFGGNDCYLRLSKEKVLTSNSNTHLFNDVKVCYNSTTDVFKVGDGDEPWFAVNRLENKVYYSPRGINKGYEIPYVVTSSTALNARTRDGGWVKYSNGLLIQWGTAVQNTTHNLPLPYTNADYMSMATLDNQDVIYNQSETTIDVLSDNNSVVHWMTIGQGA